MLVLPMTPHVVITGEFLITSREPAFEGRLDKRVIRIDVSFQVAGLRAPIVTVGHIARKVALVALAVLLQLSLGVITLATIFFGTGEGVFGLVFCLRLCL